MDPGHDLVRIDGAYGEGGGQVLRTSLGLSVLTGRPFEISNIRAKRSKPGLRPQHLQCVLAAGQIGRAKVKGAEIGSLRLRFEPELIRAGEYRFEVGTAGAAALVSQTIFFPLSLAKDRSQVTIIGGTHVPWSPCFHYLDRQWAFYMRQLGFAPELRLLRAGYFPAGGGEIHLSVDPISTIVTLDSRERGDLVEIEGLSLVSNLDRGIARRQKERAERRLSEHGHSCSVRTLQLGSPGKGTMLLLLGKFQHSQCCYFGLGARGKRAEKVADEACDGFHRFMGTRAAVDEHLADQLLLPLALAAGESFFTTPTITQHLITNAWVIRQFIDAEVTTGTEPGNEGLVTVRGVGLRQLAP